MLFILERIGEGAIMQRVEACQVHQGSGEVYILLYYWYQMTFSKW